MDTRLPFPPAGARARPGSSFVNYFAVEAADALCVRICKLGHGKLEVLYTPT